MNYGMNKLLAILMLIGAMTTYRGAYEVAGLWSTALGAATGLLVAMAVGRIIAAANQAQQRKGRATR